MDELYLYPLDLRGGCKDKEQGRHIQSLDGLAIIGLQLHPRTEP